MTRKPANIVPRRAEAVPAASQPLASSKKMVALVFAELQPTLPVGMDERSYLVDTYEFIGDHPDVVLKSAYEAIRSTYSFAPKKAEIIQAILNAYLRLGIPLSPDAKRHASYRKKLPARYAISDAGEKRFADDAKVTLIGYFTLQGPQANIIIDSMPGATVEDVEKAIQPVAKALKGLGDKVAADDVLDRFRHEVAAQIAYRTHGDPAEQCGGQVAEVFGRSKSFVLTSPWFALSQTTVDRLRDRYPHARCRDDVHSWAEAVKAAFLAVITAGLDHERYGAGLQQEAEIRVEERLAEMHRLGRIELLSLRRYEARGLATALNAITVAERRLADGAVTAATVTIDGERMGLDSTEKCAVARRKAVAFQEKLDRQIAALAGEQT